MLVVKAYPRLSMWFECKRWHLRKMLGQKMRGQKMREQTLSTCKSLDMRRRGSIHRPLCNGVRPVCPRIFPGRVKVLEFKTNVLGNLVPLLKKSLSPLKYGITTAFNMACERSVALAARNDCPKSSADFLDTILRSTRWSTDCQSWLSGNLLATSAHISTSSLHAILSELRLLRGIRTSANPDFEVEIAYSCESVALMYLSVIFPFAESSSPSSHFCSA